MGSNPRKLTAKQALFVEEYLVDLNATQAAIRAGYSEKTAESIGHENLRKPEIATAIAEARARRSEKTGITQERVLSELATMAFSNITHYVIDDAGNLTAAPDAPPNAMAAIASMKRKAWDDGEGGHNVEVEFKLWNKPETLKLYGRHLGLFTNKEEEPPPTNIVVYAGMRPPEDIDSDDGARPSGSSLPS